MYSIIATPVGNIRIEEQEGKITKIQYTKEESLEPSSPVLKMAAKQLREYFAGQRTEFDLPLNPEGTDFQRKVWHALEEIPYGEVRTYKQIAERIGKPMACRAVGMANNKNPIMIVVPCHRVIGSNGSLIGYAYGIKVKQKLITLEKGNTKYNLIQ